MHAPWPKNLQARVEDTRWEIQVLTVGSAVRRVQFGTCADREKCPAVCSRRTLNQVRKVYRPNGPMMTWAQRAKAGVDAKHSQQALKAKSCRGQG